MKEKKKLTQKEFEEKVREFGKEGLTSEKIGQKLRDEGIHPKEYTGKISKILGELYKNPDLKNTYGRPKIPAPTVVPTRAKTACQKFSPLCKLF